MKIREHQGNVHIWVPDLNDGAGGIQAFSRAYVKAIREAFPLMSLHVFVKNDLVGELDPLRKAGVIFHSVAHYPKWLRTLALVVTGIGLGLWVKPHCAITTHLHFLPALSMLRWLGGIPIMSVLHGVEAWDLHKGLRVSAMRKADHLMAVSRHTRKVVIHSYGVDPQRISVVPNTFDTERFAIGPKPEHLLQRYGLRPEQPVILTVSRLGLEEGHKGHRQVLVALELIRRQFPDVRYLVVGTGEDLPRLRLAVEARGLKKNVIFAGFAPLKELPDHYRLCDAFVMPSSKEGFGIVFLEAMASGKPVVAGCLDGSVDALDGGRLGLLVDPNDPVRIAEAVCQILAKRPDGALWNDPAALRSAVVEQFGYPRVSRLMADDVAGLLGLERQFPDDVPDFLKLGDSFPTAPRIVVVTTMPSPYHIEFFNALSAAGGILLEVVYLAGQDLNHQWQMPLIAHNHLILSETPELRATALRTICSSDLVVFNCGLDWLALKAIRERGRRRKPWVFWGEWPGFMEPDVRGTLARWFLRLPLHRHTAPIWAVGRISIERYRAQFGGSRTYYNIPYFCDLRRFLDLAVRPSSKRTFLYSGTLSHQRGVDLLARAFARLASRYPDARLVIMGAGPLESTLQTMLQEYAEKVVWLGFLPWEETQKGYAQGSVFCFPARNDGWGLQLVEALASGMPAIGTDRAGAAVEFLDGGDAGWLVPADDVGALERAMEAALLMPASEFALMQNRAREKALENTLEKGVTRVLQASTDLLSRWRARLPGRRSFFNS